jgi:hypothetical protein
MTSGKIQSRFKDSIYRSVPMVTAMMTSRNSGSNSSLMMLEAAAASARSGFVCMFSDSDEYETALISARRAQGRYGAARRSPWPIAAFIAVCVMIAGTVLLFA